jgi:hypothetical protein
VPSSTTINLRGEGGRTVSDDQGKTRTKEKVEGGKRRVSHMEPIPKSVPALRPTSPESTSISTPPIKAPRQSTSNAINSEQPQNSTRIVFEPIPAETPLPSSSSSRSVSAPIPPRHVQPRMSVVGERPASRAGPGPSGLSPIADEAIKEEDEGIIAEGEEGGEEDDLDLRWAISATEVQRPKGNGEEKESEGEIGYIRKEMVRMQMDMLRMNRDLKVSLTVSEV